MGSLSSVGSSLSSRSSGSNRGARRGAGPGSMGKGALEWAIASVPMACLCAGIPWQMRKCASGARRAALGAGALAAAAETFATARKSAQSARASPPFPSLPVASSSRGDAYADFGREGAHERLLSVEGVEAAGLLRTGSARAWASLRRRVRAARAWLYSQILASPPARRMNSTICTETEQGITGRRRQSAVLSQCAPARAACARRGALGKIRRSRGRT